MTIATDCKRGRWKIEQLPRVTNHAEHTAKIEIASSNWRMKSEMAADAPSIMIMGSLSLSTNFFQIGSLSSPASSLRPWNLCRRRTSSFLHEKEVQVGSCDAGRPAHISLEANGRVGGSLL